VLLPLEPLIDVALDPVVDVPEEPTTGALGAAGALLAAVLPVEVLGGLPPPNGAILGTAVGFRRTNAQSATSSLAWRFFAGQTLPDEPAFLLAHQKHQHRVALAPLFFRRIRAFSFGS
jgi:hypothetical protein